MKRLVPVSILTVLIISGRAHPQDNHLVDKCLPTDKATELLSGVGSLELGRRNSVDTFIEAYFLGVENRPYQISLYLKHDGTRNDFVVKENGEVAEFHQRILDAPPETKLCGAIGVDGNIGLGISTTVRFQNNSGTHSITEILDGLRDGKSHHKKNLGGVQAMFVPKMTHIAIIYDDEDAIPNISAVVANGLTVSLEFEPYGEMFVIDVEVLEEINAETIVVGGGPYELLPVPSIKKMKSLGIGSDK